MGTDFKFTLRALRHAQWYSVTVIGVIAVTLALTTTVFAVVDGVLFRPLPYPDSDRLVRIEPSFGTVPRPAAVGGEVPTYAASAVDLANWRAAVPDVNITGFSSQPMAGIGAGVNDDIAGVSRIQANFFDVVGVQPLIGGFAANDFLQSPRVRPVILMYETWQSRFGGASDVLGRVINSEPVTGFGLRIVGVMPKGFSFPSVRWTIDFLMPLVVEPGAATKPGNRSIPEVVARVPRGLSPALLAQRLGPGIAATAAQFPPLGPRPEGWSENGWRREGPYDAVEITPLGESLGSRSRAMFLAVFAAVALLVLIAAANISSLMTSRALERSREMQMRLALGAGPGAIARLWTVEALVLLSIGAALGVVAALPLLNLFIALLPDEVVLLKTARLDWRVAAFVGTAIASLCVVVSLAPIRRSLRPAGAVKGGASDRLRTPGRFMVVSAQVAAAFVLTVVGACLVGSVLAVYSVERPIRTDGVVVLEVRLRGAGGGQGLSPERAVRGLRIRDRLAQVNGVSSVALVAAQLLRGGGWTAPFAPPPGATRLRDVDMWAVSAGFYDVLRPAVVEGRVPTNDELRSSAPLLVVSERVARAYWPGVSPIGQTLTTYRKAPFTVVGVVRDVPWYAWDIDSPMIYGPYAPLAESSLLTFLVHTDGRTGPAIDQSLRALVEAEPLLRPNKAVALTTLFRDSISLRRFQSWLFGGFAAAALAVVGVGILGLLAMSTARRTKEIGIRCALGATPRSVTRLLVGEQLVPVLAGLVVGGAIAAWAVGFVKGYVYQLSVADPRIWGAAIALIVVTAGLGALLPALRASRIDPVKALRIE